MCTLTWQTEECLEVFFNRDELKTRARAEPPRLFTTKNGTRYLSPTDKDAGGTWMLANEFGLVVCLLNRWHLETSDPPKSVDSTPLSRGTLVRALADHRGNGSLKKELNEYCHQTRPFDLVVFSARKVSGYSWDGRKLVTFRPAMPLTSSSFRFESVREAREDAFQQAPNLPQFQSSSQQTPTAYTVRMNRPDAQTWSRSHLKVTSRDIQWDYWEEFPDLRKAPQLHQSSLPRQLDAETLS